MSEVSYDQLDCLCAHHSPAGCASALWRLPDLPDPPGHAVAAATRCVRGPAGSSETASALHGRRHHHHRPAGHWRGYGLRRTHGIQDLRLCEDYRLHAAGNPVGCRPGEIVRACGHGRSLGAGYIRPCARGLHDDGLPRWTSDLGGHDAHQGPPGLLRSQCRSPTTTFATLAVLSWEKGMATVTSSKASPTTRSSASSRSSRSPLKRKGRDPGRS